MNNGTLMQYFHFYYPNDGSLWKKVSGEAKNLAEMGITSLWLPPAYKAAGGNESVGYDVYDLYDLGEFNQKGSIPTRYGTKEEYLNAIKDAQAAGLLVYADIVLNHMGGGDETEQIIVKRVNPNDRNEMIGNEFEIKAFTKFLFYERKGKYSDFIWDSECFSGVDYADNLNENSIFKIINSYGDTWEDGVDQENGNFDYLMYNDIEFRNVIVREELKKWGQWYLETTHLDGFRLDAVKHIDYRFYNEWLDIIRHNSKQELFTVGEYWALGNLEPLEKYIEKTSGRMSLFDVPLHMKFYEASNAGKDFDLTKIFENTLVSANPLLAVTVVENHDTQPLQSLESPVSAWFKPLAYAFILLRQNGYPCIFYPDYYGTTYTDKDYEGNDQEIIINPVSGLKKMVELRKNQAYGEQGDYFEKPNLIGWVRRGDTDHKNSGCAVVISNFEGGRINMQIGKKFSERVFFDNLGSSVHEITINGDGWGEFSAPPGGVSVWIPK